MFCNGFGFRGMYGAGSFLMMIPMIILLLAVIYFVYKLVNGNRLNIAESSSLKAMDILNERFAKGEISEEEYNSKRKRILK